MGTHAAALSLVFHWRHAAVLAHRVRAGLCGPSTPHDTRLHPIHRCRRRDDALVHRHLRGAHEPRWCDQKTEMTRAELLERKVGERANGQHRR